MKLSIERVLRIDIDYERHWLIRDGNHVIVAEMNDFEISQFFSQYKILADRPTIMEATNGK